MKKRRTLLAGIVALLSGAVLVLDGEDKIHEWFAPQHVIGIEIEFIGMRVDRDKFAFLHPFGEPLNFDVDAVDRRTGKSLIHAANTGILSNPPVTAFYDFGGTKHFGLFVDHNTQGPLMIEPRAAAWGSIANSGREMIGAEPILIDISEKRTRSSSPGSISIVLPASGTDGRFEGNLVYQTSYVSAIDWQLLFRRAGILILMLGSAAVIVALGDFVTSRKGMKRARR